MEDAIRQALKALEKQFGKGIFSNPQQFKGALADVPIEGNGIKTRRLLNTAIDDMKAYSRLEAAMKDNSPFIVDNLVDEMVSNYWPEKATAQIAIACIAELLSGDSPLNAAASSSTGVASNTNKDAKAAFVRAKECHLNKDYDNAIKELDLSIRLNPNDSSAYVNRGAAYLMKGQCDDAIRDCGEAIRLNPNDSFAYSSRGEAYRMKGKKGEAGRDFEMALKLDPNNSFARACQEKLR